MRIPLLPTVLASALAVSTVAAQCPTEVLVTADIAVSTTWTKNFTYNLQQQIYVLPGATLTIQAGTIIASTTNLGGSLAVARGAMIVIAGTCDEPVIMTSKADVATWALSGGCPNPKTGSWREGCNEWGNLTIMGNGYISSCRNPANTPTCNAANTTLMEGLSRGAATDSYGGGNDDDDSGSISYLSLRYGGKVIGLGNELNGLSLGGIGRQTDINNVDIMNNVDDGVEIWGGTVNLCNLSIWNIGDDSLDIDQGWRGKAQGVLIVQGYSCDAVQGSGVGDNGVEIDGAEASEWQPVTTGVIYNATVIMQPLDGDSTTAWRDSGRLQFRNSIFMDCAEQVCFFEDLGDHNCGNKGYAAGGTLTWAQCWTTNWNVTSLINPCPNPGLIYQAQTSGKLIEFVDSVFYRNNAANAYTELDARLAFAVANNNVKQAASSPITAITRGPNVVKGGKTMQPVISLDPTPANDALSSVSFCSGDNYIKPLKYRGAFAPCVNWLQNWTAAAAYGYTPKGPFKDLGKAGPAGANGYPLLAATGPFSAGSLLTLKVHNAAPNSGVVFFIGFPPELNFPLFGGILVPNPAISVARPTDGSGGSSLSFPLPGNTAPGGTVLFQGLVLDGTAPPAGFAFTNACRGVTQ